MKRAGGLKNLCHPAGIQKAAQILEPPSWLSYLIRYVMMNFIPCTGLPAYSDTSYSDIPATVTCFLVHKRISMY